MIVYDGNIAPETRKRAIFVLKCKGSSLSAEVKKLIEQNAKEYNNFYKED